MIKKVYTELCITDKELIAMQKWLFPQLVDKKTTSIADLILKINLKYPEGYIRDYAIYLLGYHIGGARQAEKFGHTYVIDVNAT